MVVICRFINQVIGKFSADEDEKKKIEGDGPEAKSAQKPKEVKSSDKKTKKTREKVE